MRMIREARIDDFESIEEIGKLTWEGHDYLPRVFHEWLDDGNFFVVDVNGKAVATAKLTVLPCGVGWMEGLRVHPSYRGRGYANDLHDFLISYGKELSERGIISSLMFATHRENGASIHLGYKRGFKLVKRFYHLTGDVRSEVYVEETEPRLPNVDIVPVGWRFIKRCDESLDWLRKNVVAFKGRGESGFFIPKERSGIFTPFDYLMTEKLIEEMGSVAAKLDRRVGLMIPEDLSRVADRLREMGFSQWKGNEPDVLIFELTL